MYNDQKIRNSLRWIAALPSARINGEHKHICPDCGNAAKNGKYLGETGYYELSIGIQCNKCNCRFSYGA